LVNGAIGIRLIARDVLWLKVLSCKYEFVNGEVVIGSNRDCA